MKLSIFTSCVSDHLVEIALNNALFGTSFEGSIQNNSQGTFTGTKSGITVTYAKGDGGSMYINDEQLRLYQGNTLTISTSSGFSENARRISKTESGSGLRFSSGTSQPCTKSGSGRSLAL